MAAPGKKSTVSNCILFVTALRDMRPSYHFGCNCTKSIRDMISNEEHNCDEIAVIKNLL